MLLAAPALIQDQRLDSIHSHLPLFLWLPPLPCSLDPWQHMDAKGLQKYILDQQEQEVVLSSAVSALAQKEQVVYVCVCVCVCMFVCMGGKVVY